MGHFPHALALPVFSPLEAHIADFIGLDVTDQNVLTISTILSTWVRYSREVRMVSGETSTIVKYVKEGHGVCPPFRGVCWPLPIAILCECVVI